MNTSPFRPFIPPTDDGYQRLSGTSSQASTALAEGQNATLIVSGEIAVNVRWSASSPTAVGTDVELPAGSRVDWLVTSDTKFVATVPADGASTAECWVFNS